MKPAEYFEAVKARLNITSDYELAKTFGVGNGRIVQMRTGERPVPVDIAFKIAIALQQDPAQVVADLESQREKNASRQEFWRSFISHARAATVLLACMVAWSFSGISVDGQKAPSGFFRRRNFA